MSSSTAITTESPKSAKNFARAYSALGVDPNAVAASPKITPQMEAIGGAAKAIDYLRSSSRPLARQFMAIYDDLTLPLFVRKLLPLEAFCIAASITTDQFLSAVSQAVRDVRQFQAGVIAAEAHPDIVETSTGMALAGDLDHVNINLKHMAFLPLPKGSQVQVNVNASANAAAAAQSVLAPAPENTIRTLVNRFNMAIPGALTQPALGEGSEAPTVAELKKIGESREPALVDAEYEDADDAEQS